VLRGLPERACRKRWADFSLKDCGEVQLSEDGWNTRTASEQMLSSLLWHERQKEGCSSS